MDTKNLGFDSKLIHAGDFHDEYGSAVVPIYQTSTFAFRNAQHGADLFAGKEKGFIYTRIGNPTINALENKLAEL
ncbi:MAG: PLP-dependent transferase, partial [Bacteroidales bacterium]|nr:PLP-dependent transferase [Bacteroidales bacterium]